MKRTIHTSNAPEAIGPYSQATIHNGIIYCSGQIGIVPGTGEFAGEDVKTQADQVMKNLKAVLKEAGSGFDKVLKCSIFLADMDDFSVVNKIYGEYFPENPPARETVAAKTLPKNCRVEVGCIAHV
ncbi:MAG TPA: RidA family protein [Balneolaceae bacterium]|nr:RidA family protein [Balneolaceae bacterium]